MDNMEVGWGPVIKRGSGKEGWEEYEILSKMTKIHDINVWNYQTLETFLKLNK